MPRDCTRNGPLKGNLKARNADNREDRSREYGRARSIQISQNKKVFDRILNNRDSNLKQSRLPTHHHKSANNRGMHTTFN